MLFLTESDVRILKSVVQRVGQLPQNSPTATKTHLFQAPEVYIARPQTADGIPGLGAAPGTGTSPDMPGEANCDIYRIKIPNSPGTSTDIQDPELVQAVEKDQKVYNISTADISQDWILAVKEKFGKWIAIPTAVSAGLFEFMLEEDHPGRGTLFTVWIAVWNPATHAWDYDWDTTYECIDWRTVDSYPDRSATGLGVWRPSNAQGQIVEVVSLDCDAPGGTGTGPDN